jgi:hypothetical protein
MNVNTTSFTSNLYSLSIDCGQTLIYLREISQLERISIIIDHHLSYLNLARETVNYPAVHLAVKQFVGTMNIMNFARIPHMWLYPCSGRSILNRENLEQQLINKLNLIISDATQNKKEAIKNIVRACLVIRTMKDYVTPTDYLESLIKEFKTQLNNASKDGKIKLADNKSSESKDNNNHKIADYNLDQLEKDFSDLVIHFETSWYEKLARLSFTSVATTIFLGQIQEWKIVDLGVVAVRIGLQRTWLSNEVLGTIAVTSLAAAYICKFLEAQSSVVRDYPEEVSLREQKLYRIQACFNMAMSLLQAGLWVAILGGLQACSAHAWVVRTNLAYMALGGAKILSSRSSSSTSI